MHIRGLRSAAQDRSGGASMKPLPDHDEAADVAALTALQDYVSHFELCELVVLDKRGTRALPARPAQLLIFHLEDVSGSDLLHHRTGKIVATRRLEFCDHK